MKKFATIYLFAFVVSSCVQPKQSQFTEQEAIDTGIIVDSVEVSLDNIDCPQMDSIVVPVDSVEDLSAKYSDLDDGWLPYLDTIKDTLHSAYEFPARSEYFLYDMTGDGKDELWIKTMSCEANAKINVFTLDKGTPRQIYEGNGFHTDFFIFEGRLVCVSCWMGSGQIVNYRYVNGVIKEHAVKYSSLNEDGIPISNSAKANRQLDYWNNNHDQFIILKEL